jgi:cytochrome c oxidase subunit 3
MTQLAMHPPAEHFDSLERQTNAATLGMWLFVGSELLFFGGLFAVYFALRVRYGASFVEAATHSKLAIGTTNTLLLLVSSYFVAVGASAPRRGASRRVATVCLGVAVLIGAMFLTLKGIEYWEHFREGIYPAGLYHYAEAPSNGARTFFTLYFFMTGLHAIHVAIGMGLLLWLARRCARGDFDGEYSTPLELGGMYWHLVDIIWLFLWPCFYLLR